MSVILGFSFGQQHSGTRRRWATSLAAVFASFAVLCGAGQALAKERAMILVYDGFGTPAKARFWGRVLEDKGFDKPKKKERWHRRLKRSYRLLESDEIPHAKVLLKVAGRERKVKADKEGLFVAEFTGLPPGVHQVDAELMGKMPYRQRQGRLFVAEPSKGARVAVISDIDDTVLASGIKNKLKLVKKVLLGNVHRLKSYPHAPALYRRFRQRKIPIVFVSGSPINLQPRLAGFFELRKFPRAPMLLKNLGMGDKSDSLFKQRQYKEGRIAQVMALLPNYRFVLIGDSGEKDPEIYRAVKKRFKGRVLVTLIHAMKGAKSKDARYAGQHLFRSYAEAAKLLRKKGILTAEDSTAVESAP